MFKVRMQGQYGGAGDKRLRVVASEMWAQWGLRRGIMRGYWVTVAREIPAYAGSAAESSDLFAQPLTSLDSI
jgi:solute carrier family 25 carnitine/acylcarnitine transporter 20/29